MASIQLSGSVGSGGSFSILGFANVTITGNADLTLNLAQYSNYFVKVSSDGASLAVRKVTVPLNEGTTFVVENATSEGFAINVIGPAGTGVVIPSGQSALVYTDGTNYIGLGFSGGGSNLPWIATVNHAASPFQATAATVYIPVDPTGGTTVIVAPVKPAAGQVFFVSAITTSTNAVEVNINGGEAGVFIEDPSNPGSFASSVTVQGIGGVAGWKYDAATLQWIGIVGFISLATSTIPGLILEPTDSGLWHQTAGVLDVASFVGATPGTVPTTNAAGTDTPFAFIFGTWTADVLPAASPFTPTAAQIMVAVNTSTGAVTVNTPAAPVNGQMFCIKPTAASATPITVAANGGGITVENPSNAGNFGATGSIPGQGSGAWFKFRSSDSKWIAMPGGF